MRVSPKSTVLVCALFVASALGAEMGEYQVKSLFLYNIAQFIQWPEDTFKDANSPIIFCILEPNPFDDVLERTMDKRMIGGRTAVVRPIPDLKQAFGCQILFVGSSQSKHPRALLEDLRMTGLLIVGEVAGFAKDGGVVNFKLKGGSVRLEINVAAAERERLHISSKLLSLAEIVK
jgi:hypothetical protein